MAPSRAIVREHPGVVARREQCRGSDLCFAGTGLVAARAQVCPARTGSATPQPQRRKLNSQATRACLVRRSLRPNRSLTAHRDRLGKLDESSSTDEVRTDRSVHQRKRRCDDPSRVDTPCRRTSPAVTVPEAPRGTLHCVVDKHDFSLLRSRSRHKSSTACRDRDHFDRRSPWSRRGGVVRVNAW